MTEDKEPLIQPHVQSSGVVRTHLLPLTGYFLLTLLYTWPTIPHFFSHIPGTGDASWFLWQFWWFKHALLDLRQSPYLTNVIYYPLQDVPVMAQTPVNELFSLPLQVAFNVVSLNNLLFVFTYLLTGYFTYLLGIALTRRRDLAFVGGVIFAFCAARGIRSLGHMSLLTTQWMPLFLLLALQCQRRPSWQRGVAAGIAAALVALSSPYYIGLFLFPVGLVGALYLVLWQRASLGQKKLWQAALLGALAFLGLTVPPYLHYLQLEPELYQLIDELQTGSATYAADLLSWWLPSGMHPFWRAFTAPFYASFTTPNLMETTVFVGYLPLLCLLFSFGLRRVSPSLRFWQMLAVFGWLLSLGPVLHVNGKPLFTPLPYAFLEALPGFSGFRVPSRAGITAALALSMVAMLVLQQLLARYRRAPWPIILTAGTLLIFVNNLVEFPMRATAMRIPTIYDTVAADPAPTALLELPAGEFFQKNYNFFGEISQAMYYQSYHHKPLVSGYLGRRPARLAVPEHTLPFVRRFFTDQAQQSQIYFPGRAFLPEPFLPNEVARAPWLLQQAGIGYIALHQPQGLPSFYTQAIPRLNQAVGLPSQTDGSHRVYRIQPPAYQTYDTPLFPFLTVTPRYSAAFAPPQQDGQGVTRMLTADSAISFTLPFTGVWALHGEWVGSAAAAVEAQLDDMPLALQRDPYTEQTVAWQATLTTTAGLHRLRLPLPAPNQATAAAPCATLCLRDFTARLVQPTIPADRPPLATFVNATNQQAELLAMTFLTTAATVEPAHQSAWLVTAWRLDATTFAQAQQDPQQLPALYLHFTTADGHTQHQADHRLGERRLLRTDAPILFDLLPLPMATADLATYEVRLGLWYPEQQTYFWATDPQSVDEGNRFNLGPLAHWQQAIEPPAIVSTPAIQTVFRSEDDEEPFVLLQARLVAGEQGERPGLLTTWRTPYTFDQQDGINLRLYLTDAAGTALAETAQRLGDADLLDEASPYMIDYTVLPAVNAAPSELFVWLAVESPTTNALLPATAIRARIKQNRVRLGAWAELADKAVASDE